MHSIRTKMTLMTVCTITAAMIAATIFGVTALRRSANCSAEETLTLLCKAGEKNLDSYFERVEQSVSMVSAYVESDLDGLEDQQLQAHLDRVSAMFQKLIYNNNGLLTYYYRIDPSVSERVKGFWYVNQNGVGFRPHEVTDITQYDTQDTSKLVWFTVPKATGKPIWLPPYITDNLGARVISYNVPVYLDGTFVGVIGIELDYSAMAEQVDNIRLYQNGYAFLNDADGEIIYHPRMDATQMTDQITAPEGLLSHTSIVRYTYEGVEKEAVWLPLSNGMRLYVTVPVSEINADWERWAAEMITVFAALILLASILTAGLTERFTRPLRELTRVAEQVNAGNFDCSLDYQGTDEVGILTGTFQQLTVHLKSYISSLNDLAYADALTSVHNKGAFDLLVQKLESQIQSGQESPAFAICIFDCNNLKGINDHYGHDKGDIYLRTSCSLICKIFDHSPVFRLGGDEFAAVLQNANYQNRDALLVSFDEACHEIRSEQTYPWCQVDVARGIAVYRPGSDQGVNDVVRRADKRMYENKRLSKSRVRIL